MRTVNREPRTLDVVDKDDLGYKYFNHYNWKGVYDDKNFLGVDQESFEYTNNIYINSEGLLCSRPSLKKRKLPFAAADLVGVESFPGVNVYITKHGLYFADAHTSKLYTAMPIPSSYRLVLADNKIFIFQPNTLQYFDLTNKDEGILSGIDKIYVPNAEESPNILTGATSEHITYTGPSDDTKLVDLVGKTTTITIDGTEYSRTFVTGLQKGFLSQVEEITAEEAKSASVKGTSILLYTWQSLSRTYKIRYKVGASTWATIESPSTPEESVVINMPRPALSEDGYHICYPILNGRIWTIYCISIVATEEGGSKKWSDWTSVFTITYATGEADLQNGPSMKLYMPDKTKIYGVSYSGKSTTVTIGNRYLCGIYTVKWNTDDGNVLKTFKSLPGTYSYTSDDSYKIDQIRMYDFIISNELFYIFVAYGSAASLIILQNDALTSSTYTYNIFVDSTRNLYALHQATPESPEEGDDAYDYNFDDYSFHFVADGSNSYIDIYGYVRSVPGLTSMYSRVKLTDTKADADYIYEAELVQINVPELIAKQDDGDVRYKPVRAIANINISNNTYITNDLLVYNESGIVRKIVTTPGTEIAENDFYDTHITYPVAIIDTTHCYFVTNQADKYYLYSTYPTGTITIDVINEGENNFLVPDFVTQLDSYFFAFGKDVYISKIGATADPDEFKWYLPKDQIQNFPEPILNMHAISSTDVAIFFESSIYYITKSEGNYYINKSKIPLGLKKGSEIVTSYDGKYTIFSTSRGLVAMAYQDFVASTEQALTYLSDNIFGMYDNWNVSPIKLYLHKFWLICYRTDSKTMYVYDMRNASWWPITSPYFVTDITEVNYELNLIANGLLYNLDTGTSYYKDDDKLVIPWEIKSQKLHFNAVNFYKHISSITFNAVTDNNDKFTFKMQVTNYRKLASEKEPETLNYKVDIIRTFVKRFNFAKVSEFQYSLYNNNEDAKPQPLAITNLSIKFKVTGNAR